MVRLGPDGALYAATLPRGKVYKLNPNAAAKQDAATATVVFDLGKVEAGKAEAGKAGDSGAVRDRGAKPVDEKADANSHYIWDMTFDAEGRLYIATGGPGAVYRMDPCLLYTSQSVVGVISHWRLRR